MNIQLENGKYRIEVDETTGVMKFFRHGEFWSAAQENLQHVKLIYAMCSRIAELESKCSAMLAAAPSVEQQPAGYIRKWAFDGEKPKKRLNANNRMAWPGKFKFLPVTQAKILPDDIPLYAAPQAADTDKVREGWSNDAESFGEALNEACLTFSGAAPKGSINGMLWMHLKPTLRTAILRYSELVSASMAAQAPVREVPEGWKLVPIEPTDAQLATLEHPDAAMRRVYKAMLAAAPLPAAPVQQEGV